MQYIYIRPQYGFYKVGFYDPRGNFILESHQRTLEDAARRVHYLNGGN